MSRAAGSIKLCGFARALFGTCKASERCTLATAAGGGAWMQRMTLRLDHPSLCSPASSPREWSRRRRIVAWIIVWHQQCSRGEPCPTYGARCGGLSNGPLGRLFTPKDTARPCHRAPTKSDGEYARSGTAMHSQRSGRLDELQSPTRHVVVVVFVVVNLIRDQ